MGHPALYIVLGFTAAAILGGWASFRRLQLARPPIGVMSLGDVAVMIGAIVLVPYLYIALPLWLVAGISALGTLSILYFLGGADPPGTPADLGRRARAAGSRHRDQPALGRRRWPVSASQRHRSGSRHRGSREPLGAERDGGPGPGRPGGGAGAL
jgi:hypothetical protein